MRLTAIGYRLLVDLGSMKIERRSGTEHPIADSQ
jgi:hypothetical protein